MSLRHVRVLAALQIAQGSLEIPMGLLFGLSPGGMGTGKGVPYFWIAMSLAGLAVAFNGLLRITAGVLTASFSGRALGLATLSFGLLSGVTILCLPTSWALFAYGLAVYASGNARAAFALRAAGSSVEEVLKVDERVQR